MQQNYEKRCLRVGQNKNQSRKNGPPLLYGIQFLLFAHSCQCINGKSHSRRGSKFFGVNLELRYQKRISEAAALSVLVSKLRVLSTIKSVLGMHAWTPELSIGNWAARRFDPTQYVYRVPITYDDIITLAPGLQVLVASVTAGRIWWGRRLHENLSNSGLDHNQAPTIRGQITASLVL